MTKTATRIRGLILSLATATTAGAEVSFVEVGAARGLEPYVMDIGLGGGLAAADFDDDGDIDLFVPNAEGVPDQLYRNLGNGNFEEIAAAAGLDSTNHSRVALWLDFDGDHRLDLFVAGDCYLDDTGHEGDGTACVDILSLRLYRQVADAVFQEVTQQAGFVDHGLFSAADHRGGLSAGDIDNDGDLDLFITLWGGPARLFENTGAGTFSEISVTSGTGLSDFYHQPMMHDWNGDGWMDIYAAVDFFPNRLWINQGDRTFVDAAPASGSDNAWNDMGQALGDIDNDGDLDIYITNVETLKRHNLLLRNDSDGGVPQFTRQTDSGAESGGWGWGTTFFDADRDGDVDLAATNGRINSPQIPDTSRFFLNHGGEPVVFEDASDASGFNDALLGSSLLAVDFDRDGDLDLVQTCRALGPQESTLRLLENQLGGPAVSHRYLVVKPRMSGANSRAIGAVIRIESGGQQQMRLISAGTSYLGQEPAEAFFGTGEAMTVDQLIVEWPGGGRTVLENIATNQILRVEAPGLFADGFESGDTSAW